MTIKYRVASSAMVPRMPGALSPPAFDFVAKKRINEKARKSSACVRVGRNGGHLVRIQDIFHAP